MAIYAIELKVQTRLPYDEVVRSIQHLYDICNVGGTFKVYRNSLFDYDNVVIQFARELTEDHNLIQTHMKSMCITASEAAVYQLKLEVEFAIAGCSDKLDFYNDLQAAFANRERYRVDFRGSEEPDTAPAPDNELAGRAMIEGMVKAEVTETLAHIRNDIERVAEAVSMDLKNIRDEMSRAWRCIQELENTPTGAAVQAFVDKKDALNEQIEAVKDLLKSLQNRVHDIEEWKNEQYDDMEQAKRDIQQLEKDVGRIDRSDARELDDYVKKDELSEVFKECLEDGTLSLVVSVET